MQFRSKKLFRFALLVLLLSIINWAGANTDTWFDNNDGYTFTFNLGSCQLGLSLTL